MLKKFKRNLAVARLIEEQLYEQVAAELAQGYTREGLWAKALADGKGDEIRAKGLYLKYRVRSLSDEAEIVDALTETRSLSSHEDRIVTKPDLQYDSEVNREREHIENERVQRRADERAESERSEREHDRNVGVDLGGMESRVAACEEKLRQKGMALKSALNGWIVTDSTGHPKEHPTLASLELHVELLD